MFNEYLSLNEYFWFIDPKEENEDSSRPDLMLPHAFKDNEANYEYEDEKPTVAVARAMATRKFNFA